MLYSHFLEKSAREYTKEYYGLALRALPGRFCVKRVDKNMKMGTIANRYEYR